jgi:hypothetical protein
MCINKRAGSKTKTNNPTRKRKHMTDTTDITDLYNTAQSPFIIVLDTGHTFVCAGAKVSSLSALLYDARMITVWDNKEGIAALYDGPTKDTTILKPAPATLVMLHKVLYFMPVDGSKWGYV